MGDAEEPRLRPRRVIPVQVSELAIADGQARPPALGDVVGYWLTFTETEPGTPGSAFRVTAEPISDRAPEPGKQWDGAPDIGRAPSWTVRLHGDGWLATWVGPRPVLGGVELHGKLVASISIDSPVLVRGRITRVEGRAVDLDLDDLPVRLLRPSIVPGAVAGTGSDLWVADERLPLAVRIRDRSTVTVFTWPGGILAADSRGSRQLLLDAEGCWLTGPDGVRRLDSEGTVRQVEKDPVSLVAANRGTLAIRVGPARSNAQVPAALRLVEPSGDVIDVPVPHRGIRSLIADGDGFEVVLSRSDSASGPVLRDESPPWRARLDRRGQLVDGPVIAGNVLVHGRADAVATIPDGVDVAALLDAATERSRIDESTVVRPQDPVEQPAPTPRPVQPQTLHDPSPDEVLDAVRAMIASELARVDNPVTGMPGGDPSDASGWRGIGADGKPTGWGKPLYNVEGWRWFRLIDLARLDEEVIIKFGWDEPETPDLQYLIFAHTGRYEAHGAHAAAMVVRACLRDLLGPYDALKSAPTNKTPGWRNRASRLWLSRTLVLLNPPDGGYEQVDLDRAWTVPAAD